MRRINDEEIRTIKEINMISFLESHGYMPRYRHGDSAMFFSPLREEKNPSFYVSKWKGQWYWKDWGTGERGDLIELVERLFGYSFTDAVEYILGGKIEDAGGNAQNQQKEDKSDEDWIRAFYAKLPSSEEPARAYFKRLGLNYYPEMGARLCHANPVDGEEEFVAVPIPYPEKIRGLELRGFVNGARKTLGKKTLWLLKRNTEKVLVTESIVDALAGEIILDDRKITLCSINGVGNVKKLRKFVEKYRPARVILALDADEPGRAAQETARSIISDLAEVDIIYDHVRAGVKDLYELLVKERKQCSSTLSL